MSSRTRNLPPQRSRNHAFALYAEGKVAESLAVALKALETARRDVSLLDLAAICHMLLGQAESAAACWRQALAIQPNFAHACNGLGTLLAQKRQFEEAEFHYRQALVYAPDYVDAHNNLGNLLKELKRDQEAESAYRQVLRLMPNHAPACNNLGSLLASQQRHDEAHAAYQQALRLQPNNPDVYNNLGNLLKSCHRYEEAEAAYRQALRLKPNHAEACNNLGTLLEIHHRYEEAEAVYRKALRFKPDYLTAWYNLGGLLAGQARMAEAVQAFETLLTMAPDHAAGRWRLAFMDLLPFYHTREEQKRSREKFHEAIQALYPWFEARQWFSGPECVGSWQPFHLAYHEEDNRDLLTCYSDLCVRLMETWRAQADRPPPVPRDRDHRIRVGFVSRFFHHHSVWNAITKGWMTRFDTNRFEVMAFCTDEEPRTTSHVGVFIQGPKSLEEWVDGILTAQPDVLIYPELGMDGMSYRLAALRLAPVQMTAWGHPETSGLSTMDYYLSAALFEPEEADRYYREKLVRLPNLGVYCERMTRAGQAIPPSHFGLDANRPILICAGAPFKYPPAHDEVFADLVRRLAGCQLVFFRHPKYQALGLQLANRLRERFQEEGLSFDQQVFFLPWMADEMFHGFMRSATLMLDTIGFSGFNTVLQAVECGLPVVTLQGCFMRGRLGAGILHRLGLAELVAGHTASYVELAVRLATDETCRQSMQARMAQALPDLFHDMAPVTYLQKLLEEVVPPQG